MFLGCSTLGIISSVLVIIGLRKDQREFLVPWILVMTLDIFVAIIHFIYVVIFGNLKFAPLTGMLFTIDFFMLCLNVSTKSKKKAPRLDSHFRFLSSYRCTVSYASCLNIKSTKSVGD